MCLSFISDFMPESHFKLVSLNAKNSWSARTHLTFSKKHVQKKTIQRLRTPDSQTKTSGKPSHTHHTFTVTPTHATHALYLFHSLSHTHMHTHTNTCSHTLLEMRSHMAPQALTHSHKHSADTLQGHVVGSDRFCSPHLYGVTTDQIHSHT